MSQSSISVDQDQFSCLLCLKLLQDPVTIPCGHSYCMGCIRNWWDRNNRAAVHSCPQCRQNFTNRPSLARNILLAEMVQKLKRGTKRQASNTCLECQSFACTHLQSQQKHQMTESHRPQSEKYCSVHGKDLEVYCRTDASSICLLCVIDTHQDHDTVSIVAERTEQQKQLEAKQRRSQQKLQEREKALKELRLTTESLKGSTEAAVKNSEKMFTELIYTAERWRTEAEGLIRAQERAAVSRAEELLVQLEREIAELKRTDSELKQLSLTDDHVDFLKRWTLLCSHPEPDDLSDISLNSQLPFEMLKSSISDLKQQLGQVCEMQIPCIPQTVDEVASLAVQTPELSCAPEPCTRQEFLQYACQLTFNPDTAHRELSLSAGFREVKRLRVTQRYAAHPERFTGKSQVLCREGLSGSRFYWEVELLGNKAEVAVTYQGISKKGTSPAASFGGNKLSWSLDCIKGVYTFCHNNMCFDIKAPYCPRVGVYLDHSMGILSFYSISDNMTLLHRCQTTFTEPVYAGFWIGEGVIVKLCNLELSGTHAAGSRRGVEQNN